MPGTACDALQATVVAVRGACELREAVSCCPPDPVQASAASKWLSKHRIDPNDPRNALLLELLRAREAAAHTGHSVGAAGIFRYELTRDLAVTWHS